MASLEHDQLHLYRPVLDYPDGNHYLSKCSVHSLLCELDSNHECYYAVRCQSLGFAEPPKTHSFTSMFIVAAIVSAGSWIIRYRILNMYSRLPPEPQRKEPEIDLFPDTHEGGIKSGLANYLDEFLSAIKIFGYLERSVFHELTRSMQTRKLIAGETMNLEEEKGFCIVVDGQVEIFVKSGRNPRAPVRSGSQDDLFNSSDDEDTLPGQQKYQLLTEVRNGAPMSSLFPSCLCSQRM